MNALFKFISYAEAISYLFLLGIAMPMKYLQNDERFMSSAGMGHGVFFMLFIGMLIYLAVERKWGAKTVLIGFVSSLLPFMPFWFHRKHIDGMEGEGDVDGALDGHH